MEEFFEGSAKMLEFARVELMPNGVDTKVVPVKKEVFVKPGMRDGMQLRFVGEGNACSGKRAGDLVVTIKEASHATLRRDGDDLIYRHKISLCDALSMQVVEFKTLDGEVIRFRPDQMVTPEFTQVFRGKGMPKYNDDPLSPLMMNHTKGNFVLKFQIEFPKQLS